MFLIVEHRLGVNATALFDVQYIYLYEGGSLFTRKKNLA
jgi:hypothetical protein